MTEEQIRRLAEDVLRPTLGPFGFDHAEVRFGEDHGGDPAIFVEAHFRKGSEPTPGRATVKASGDLFRAFFERGDHRFPYLEHRFEDDEVAAE
jgi:hypothetical protein